MSGSVRLYSMTEFTMSSSNGVHILLYSMIPPGEAAIIFIISKTINTSLFHLGGFYSFNVYHCISLWHVEMYFGAICGKIMFSIDCLALMLGQNNL